MRVARPFLVLPPRSYGVVTTANAWDERGGRSFACSQTAPFVLHRSLSRAAFALVLGALGLPACKYVDRYLPGGGGLQAALEAEAPTSEVEAVRAFYAAGDYAPLWTSAQGVTPEADSLLDRLCNAATEGLSPNDYNFTRLEAAQRRLDTAVKDSADAASLAALDVAMSEAFVAYANDLTRGRVRLRDLGGEWHLPSDTTDDVTGATLGEVRSKGLTGALDGLFARHQGYGDLRRALAHYRRIAAAGGWGTVSGRGDAEGLRRRLTLTGDLDSAVTDVRAGVARFQRRHGLDSTGVADAKTLAALNVPAEQRVLQLEVNLERRRWMPASYGSTYISVNIPDYRLRAFEGGRSVLEMPVIVGEEANRTPAFADTMQYVVFAPYWNVPVSIATKELWPKGTRYLARRNFEAVRGESSVVPFSDVTRGGLEAGTVRLRQKPGPTNALGNVKFIFPNSMNIYLHDTPGKAAFDRSARSLSHGCVRVARAEALAAFVLGPNGDWSAERIAASLDSTKEHTVNLKRKVPVVLEYLTAWADADGTVHFRDDIYGHDDRLAQALVRDRRATASGVCRRPGSVAVPLALPDSAGADTTVLGDAVRDDSTSAREDEARGAGAGRRAE